MVNITRVPQVNFLSKLASANPTNLPIDVWIEVLDRSSVKESVATVLLIMEVEDWRTPIKEYLFIETLPSNRNEIIKLTKGASGYCLIDGVLYQRSASSLLLKCLSL